MTEAEYLAKRQNYATSDADMEIIDEAILKLDQQWLQQQESLVEGGELDDTE